MTRWEGFVGRTAVVTGAGGGMGLEIATELLAAGATVAGIDVKDRPEALDDALYRQGDISDDNFVCQAIGSAYAETGQLDYLVNAAGVLWFGRDRSLVDIELEVWNRVIAINLTGCMLTARRAVPLMQKSGGGAMVHFSSTQCLRGDDKPQDAYQVAKAGILALSKSIAIQFARDNIRSNVIPAERDREPDAGALGKGPGAEAAHRRRRTARPGRHHGGHGERLPVPLVRPGVLHHRYRTSGRRRPHGAALRIRVAPRGLMARNAFALS
jgi:NAD(P)-dependent dehydrogenase (short-subunit alcohol dehydrogenase family)